MAKKTGLRFGSKAGEYQVLVRPRRDIWGGPNKDVLVDVVPALTASFGFTTGEYLYQNPLTGAMDRGADIRGHFFDLDEYAEREGLSDEDVDLVARVLKQQCQKTPDMVWEIEDAKPVAPWPKYDSAHHNAIPTLAEQLGLVSEALAYEKATKARESVVERLEELLKAQEPLEALEAV